MRNILISTLFVSVALFASEDKVIMVDSADADMKAAIAKAQKTLPDFIERYRKVFPDVESYRLKVMVKDNGNVEHLWVTPFRPTKDGRYEGLIANEPELVKNVKPGQLYQFSLSDVSDWGYVENGRQYGSYTVCALFKTMPKDEVDYYKKNHGFVCE